MVEPVYPTYDFEDGRTLLKAIGSFWSRVFTEVPRLTNEFTANGEVFRQTTDDFLEAVDTVSRFKTPPFHRRRLFLLELKQSKLVESSKFLQYGGDAVYGPQADDGKIFLYGEPAFSRFIFDIDNIIEDEVLADNFFIMNRLIDPSLVLTKGIDFEVNHREKTIQFDEDPFDSTLWGRRTIYGANNEVEDEELRMWLFMGDFDKNYVFDHFGYVLQMAQALSSEFYKDLVNSYWNTFTETPTIRNIRDMIGALAGVPTIRTETETVEFIEETAGKLQIVTDVDVYKFQPTATSLVAVGDVVTEGTELVDTVEIIELSGSNRDITGCPALPLGREFISGGYFSQLIFENRETTLDYLGIDSDGKAVVEFAVGGFPGDVDLFWERALAQGKADGATLAELLDTRTNPPTDPSLPASITQPGPEHLPSVVNPMEFMIDNVLKNNMFIIKLKPADTDPKAVGLDFFHLLRAAIPPHTTFIVIVETPDQLDTIDLGQQGGIDTCIGLDSDEPGVQDESFNDQDTCTSVPLFNFFDAPDSRPLDEIGVTDPLDGTAWIEEAMIRPRIIEGELL